MLIGVLNPDNEDLFLPRPLDEAPNVRDDRRALVSPLDDSVLHVNDEESVFGLCSSVVMISRSDASSGWVATPAGLPSGADGWPCLPRAR
jgi:hypothetical protein